MAGKKKEVKHAFPLADDVTLDLDGKKYRLCLGFGELREAERLLAEKGIYVNLLRSLQFDTIGVQSLPELFYAALHRYQPGLTFEDVCGLITLKSATTIFKALGRAYVVALGVTDENPSKAGESKIDETN